MAAKKNDPRREARIAKNNRNLNSALTLFNAGVIAQFYLLVINQYVVKGSGEQVVAGAVYDVALGDARGLRVGAH